MFLKRIFYPAIIFPVLLWLAGCSMLHTETVEPVPAPTERPTDRKVEPAPILRPSRPVEPEVRPSTPRRSPAAVTGLQRTAAKQVRAGQFAQAAATLERGLRISPGDPRLWQQLAAVRLEQKKWRLALNMAAKSNSLAGQQQSLQAGNWQIIAQAWQALGNSAKARHARNKARSLSGR